MTTGTDPFPELHAKTIAAWIHASEWRARLVRALIPGLAVTLDVTVAELNRRGGPICEHGKH